MVEAASRTSYQKPPWTSAVGSREEILAELEAFPLFSNTPADGLSPDDLRQVFSPDTPIEALHLSVRSRNVLITLKIDNLGQLLLLTVDQLMHTRNFGRKCLNEVQRIVWKWIVEERSFPVIVPGPDYLTNPVDETNLHQLPLYTNVEQKGILPSDLHPSYKSEIAINELRLPVRAINVLNTLEFTTIGKLLLTRSGELMKYRNCGRKSLKDIQRAVQIFLCEEKEPTLRPSLAFSSFNDLIRSSLMAGMRNKERNVNIALKRMGWDEEEIPTLEEVARVFCLTRERVRQIEVMAQKVLIHPATIRSQQQFWDAVENIIYRAGGVVGLEELAVDIKKYFKWNSAISPHMLGCFMALRPGLVVDEKHHWICSNKLPCVKCKKISLWVKEIVIQSDRMTFVGLQDVTHDRCMTATCKLPQDDRPRHSLAFFKCLLENDPTLNDHIYLDAMTFINREDYILREGRVGKAIEILLRQAGRPLHHTQVTYQLNQMRGDESTTEHNAYAVLERLPNIIFWGRGIFVHQDCVTPPLDLLDEIAISLRERLQTGAPFMAIHSVYEQFINECSDHGLPNDQALYSCLRKWRPLDMQFTHYPYIYGPDQTGEKMSITLLIEQFIQDSGEEISVEEINHYVKEHVGWLNPNEQHVLGKIPNILKTLEGKYLHISYLNRLPSATQDLLQFTRRLAQTHSHVSVLKIWREKCVTCRLIGLRDPRMLFDYLRLHSEDDLILSSYPQIHAAHEDQIEKHNESVPDIIVRYLLDQGHPVSYPEVETHFVEQLGYKQNSLIAALNREDVLRCSTQMYVHKHTIGWDSYKQQALHEDAALYFQQACNSGRPWGMIKELLEVGDLPVLEGKCLWTDCLLTELLSCNDNIRILGNQRNAFVILPNNAEIESFADLAAWILEHEFMGAAHVQDFSDQLVRYGIIKGMIRPGMLQESQKLCIEGQQIILGRFAKHVRNN